MGDLSIDITHMTRALALARAAQAAGEVPVGAVLVLGDDVIAQAHNRTLLDGDPTAHAEMVVLREAARVSGGYWHHMRQETPAAEVMDHVFQDALRNHRLVGTTLYVTLEPCAMCAGALVQARVARLVFGAFDPRAGAVCSVFRVLDEPRLNHRVAWTGGVMADESAALLQAFFRARRA
jgi:tRNA(adenine34) deaminase